MLRLTRRADAPVRRTASVAHRGAGSCPEPRLQRPAWSIPVSYRIESCRRYAHEFARRPQNLERLLSINPPRLVFKPLEARAYTTKADHEDQQTTNGLQEAENPQQSEGTSESPSVVDHGLAGQEDTRHEAQQDPDQQAKRDAKKKKKNGPKAPDPNPKKGLITPRNIEMKALHPDQSFTVPRLKYFLDRVLFMGGGVVQLQDEHSHVYNFDPYLGTIMPVEEFDFDALSPYVTSSKDSTLRQMAAKSSLKYCGSTSSMTGILSHLHYLLSDWKPPNFDYISKGFIQDSENFTILSRAPVALFLHHDNGVYALDADKEFDQENVLSRLGHSMEKLLTVTKEEYETYRKTRAQGNDKKPDSNRDAYHYSKVGDFLIRAQLDARDSRLPGTGVFDVKTRAVVSIRMDVIGYEKGTGYEIRSRFGQYESYEREYFDMIRAAFLKYSLQVRLGRMDGIFVAYHNTQRIFGFQYIPLKEMDKAIHGTTQTSLGDLELKASLKILNDLFDTATKRFPGQTLRIHVETTKQSSGHAGMHFFAEPVTEEQMKSIQQERNDSDVEQIKSSIYDIANDESRTALADDVEESHASAKQQSEQEGVDVAQNKAIWKRMTSQLEKLIADEYHGVRRVRRALKDMLEARNLLQGASDEDITRHLDSLVEALTLHLYEANRTKDVDQENETEDENGASTKPNAELAVEEETDDSPSEPDTSPVTPEADEIADAAKAAAFETGVLKDLLLQVTDGIAAGVEGSRGFEKAFARIVTEVQMKGETAQTNDATLQDSQSKPKPQLMGLFVTVSHKVNGETVMKPPSSSSGDWKIDYTFREHKPEAVHRIYEALKRRRADIYDKDPEKLSRGWRRMFGGKLIEMSKRGAKMREKRSAVEHGRTLSVAWLSRKQEWSDWTEVNPLSNSRSKTQSRQEMKAKSASQGPSTEPSTEPSTPQLKGQAKQGFKWRSKSKSTSKSESESESESKSQP